MQINLVFMSFDLLDKPTALGRWLWIKE